MSFTYLPKSGVLTLTCLSSTSKIIYCQKHAYSIILITESEWDLTKGYPE